MVITIDVSNPDNDVKLVGLDAGQTPEVVLRCARLYGVSLVQRGGTLVLSGNAQTYQA